VLIPRTDGKTVGGASPTLGINDRSGGTGARPQEIGMVSDADGPICGLAATLKLARMKARGDSLPGDVIVTLHISPQGYIDDTKDPPMMALPVSNETMNSCEGAPHRLPAASPAIVRSSQGDNPACRCNTHQQFTKWCSQQ
jgi:hypothetical protein